MSAAAPSSVIDAFRRLEINHEPWSVRRLSTFYQPPSVEHPSGDGRLYLPRHQREWSWTHKKGLKKMRQFIDSVLHNYPIPTVILNAIDDGVRERWQIYDGRHRIETLWRFVNNRFSIIVGVGTEVYYRDLSDGDRMRFNDRQIPVATTTAASPAQLAEVFIRLNSGKSLSQADYCWASRDTPLIQSTMELLAVNKERFAPLFGGADITHRKNLPDWVGVMAGITTGNAANMTTSFERLQEHMDTPVNVARATAALDALCDLYTRATVIAPASDTHLKRYQKLGHINAFFFDAWLAAGADPATAITNWVRVIAHIRTTPVGICLITVAGAQNLNSEKLAAVKNKVTAWLTTGAVPAADGSSVDNSDDDSDL